MMNKHTVNFIKLLNNDLLTKLIVDCWSEGLNFEDFEKMVEGNEKFKEYYYSKKMFNLIYEILDEEYELDIKLYTEDN